MNTTNSGFAGSSALFELGGFAVGFLEYLGIGLLGFLFALPLFAVGLQYKAPTVGSLLLLRVGDPAFERLLGALTFPMTDRMAVQCQIRILGMLAAVRINAAQPAAVRFAEMWAGARAERAAAGVVATSLGVMLIGRAATADELAGVLHDAGYAPKED